MKLPMVTNFQPTGELHHLLSLDVLEAIDTSNTVTNGQDTSSLL